MDQLKVQALGLRWLWIAQVSDFWRSSTVSGARARFLSSTVSLLNQNIRKTVPVLLRGYSGTERAFCDFVGSSSAASR